MPQLLSRLDLAIFVTSAAFMRLTIATVIQVRAPTRPPPDGAPAHAEARRAN